MIYEKVMRIGVFTLYADYNLIYLFFIFILKKKKKNKIVDIFKNPDSIQVHRSVVYITLKCLTTPAGPPPLIHYLITEISMATSSSSLFKLAREIGTAVSQKKGGGWYGPHMAAATRAIADRMPLVDIILEVRDARVGIFVRACIHHECPFVVRLNVSLKNAPGWFRFHFHLSLIN